MQLTDEHNKLVWRENMNHLLCHDQNASTMNRWVNKLGCLRFPPCQCDVSYSAFPPDFPPKHVGTFLLFVLTVAFRHVLALDIFGCSRGLVRYILVYISFFSKARIVNHACKTASVVPCY